MASDMQQKVSVYNYEFYIYRCAISPIYNVDFINTKESLNIQLMMTRKSHMLRVSVIAIAHYPEQA